MKRTAKFSPEEKLKYVLICLEGKDSIRHTAKLIGIKHESLRRWIRNYQSLGINGLTTTSKNFYHSSEVKEMAVRDYLNGFGSLSDVCKKYGIRSNAQLQYWILKYNSHEEHKAHRTGGISIMTNGRKTTYDERVEIVKYCIENQNNYNETAQKFNVSYKQVYSWIKKYKKGGAEALQDRRGKNKTENEMSEVEKLKAKNKLLEAEIRRKQMEIDFLKKLKEIEGRRY